MESFAFCKRAEELGLDLMKQAALGERVHALQRLGLFERRRDDTQPTGRTGTDTRRTAAARTPNTAVRSAAASARNGRVASVTRTRPSYCDHSFLRTRPAFRDRSLQALVQREHVVRAPFDVVVAEHQPAEHSEVVLEVVDRICRICRRRPGEAAPSTPCAAVSSSV